MIGFLRREFWYEATWRACNKCESMFLHNEVCDGCGSDGEVIFDRDPVPLTMEIEHSVN
jgi:hypothetical protein